MDLSLICKELEQEKDWERGGGGRKREKLRKREIETDRGERE